MEYVGAILIDLGEVVPLMFGIDENEGRGIPKDIDDSRPQIWGLAMAFWQCNLRK